ncbi:hypothetical protein R5R35_009163 [Gryllus longicercus]|uniref:Uncharacterized protein n=1 Tax=Gryllus longicercus TaxID=2509291 RepID=A0AAN9VE36_9ORTH
MAQNYLAFCITPEIGLRFSSCRSVVRPTATFCGAAHPPLPVAHAPPPTRAPGCPLPPFAAARRRRRFCGGAGAVGPTARRCGRLMPLCVYPRVFRPQSIVSVPRRNFARVRPRAVPRPAPGDRRKKPQRAARQGGAERGGEGPGGAGLAAAAPRDQPRQKSDRVAAPASEPAPAPPTAADPVVFRPASAPAPPPLPPRSAHPLVNKLPEVYLPQGELQLRRPQASACRSHQSTRGRRDSVLVGTRERFFRARRVDP